jgi:IS1 family transposase
MDFAMVSDLFFYQLALMALLWLCLMLHCAWPSDRATTRPTPPRRKRRREPTPFAGLTTKPHCDACEHGTAPPPARPLSSAPAHGAHAGATTAGGHFYPFLPEPGLCLSGLGRLGNLRANGHPNGGPWRQLLCVACRGYFLETLGTIFYGKRASVELIVRVIACLAEGLGIRGTARVFEVDPNTVLQWLVEAAEQLWAFARHVLHDVRVRQVQLDELFALLSAVKAREVSAAEAIERLERSPQWVWVAMAPESKLLLALDVGERTLAMAQRFVHQVAQVLAPDCAPLFLTDGFRAYLTALLTHYGYWMQPERRHATGPVPKPRWMPLPQLLYAQVVKTVRRRRLVRVRHRVVFGTLKAIQCVLAACGWQINTAFVERLNRDIRQHVAAVGRRVSTLCKGEDGLCHQLSLYQSYYNFCLPHSSLRQPLPLPEPTNSMGSAKQWQPCTPAMAAGLTDRVWTLRKMLLFRVPVRPKN